MPRAFLIKKKGRAAGVVVTSAGGPDNLCGGERDGEHNSNNNHTDLADSAAENKENLDEKIRGGLGDWDVSVVRRKDDARRQWTGWTIQEDEEDERGQAHKDSLPPCLEERGSSESLAHTIPDARPSPVSVRAASMDTMQQFPTDLSTKPSSLTSHYFTSFTSSPPPSPSSSLSPPLPSSAHSSHRRPQSPSEMPQQPAGIRDDGDITDRSVSARSPNVSRNQQSVPPQTLPVKPRKRPSDFSTAFLLSHNHHQTEPKRSFLPFHEATTTISAASSFERSFSPPQDTTTSLYPQEPFPVSVSPKAAKVADRVTRSDMREGGVGREDMQLPVPIIPSPSKLTTPCLSMSTWLEQPISPVLHSAYQTSRNREDRVSISSSSVDPPSPGQDPDRCFPSPLGLRRGEDGGPSAFHSSSGRRSVVDMVVGRDLASWRLKEAESAPTTVSPPSLAAGDSRGDGSPHERKLSASTSPRDHSVFASPHELMTSAHGRLALGGEPRRGTSTSPAHSERTSSGCGSPTDSSEGSPPGGGQLPRHPADLPWGMHNGPAFLPHSLSTQPHHPFLHMGLRYLPGMPLPGLTKPLPDLPLPFPYPKSLPEGLESAFRSPRPSFVHPAAAAYFSSMRSSMPYPFPFSSPGTDGVGKPSLREEPAQQGAERLEMLRALRKGSLDPIAATFQSPTSQHSSHVRPAGTSALSPRSVRPSATGSSISSVTDRVSRSSMDLKDLSRGLTVSAAGMAQSAAGIGIGIGMDNGELKIRTKDHEPVRYQCEACSKSYSTFSGLSKHKQFHCSAQVKKEFSCKHCDKTYVSLGALKMHIRTHTLPCKCTVCGKAFSRPWLLQGHLRTHTGEKPFSCPHCARAFADRSNLRAHLQTHSDVKKYSCRHCAKTFSRMSLLLKHEDGCCTSAV